VCGSRLWVRFRMRERVVGAWFAIGEGSFRGSLLFLVGGWAFGFEGSVWFRVGVRGNMVYCGIIILMCTATATTTTLNPTIAT
jgi:hypothetical protein